MLLSVASLKSPPKVTTGARQAKYMNIMEATHWIDQPSLKSDL